MFDKEDTILLVIDVQGKLAQSVDQKEKLFDAINKLVKGSQILGIPILVTEQVPQKIGSTIPEIINNIENPTIIEKASFSCYQNQDFVNRIKLCNRKQVVVVGIEAHVCVMQTVADLIANDYQVQVVFDAVSSRSIENKMVAIERMRAKGADITTSEMVITELLKTAEDKNFKEIMSLIK